MNIKESRKIFTKIAYYSFYLAVILEVLMVLIDKSALINPIEGRMFQITFLLFFIKVCLSKYSRKEYLLILMFLILGAVSYFVTGRNEIVRIVMFIAACKDINMQNCLKLVFYLTLLGCALIIALSVFGIGGGMFLVQEYGRGEIETRYTLGMGHPNALHCMVWAIIVLSLYLYGEKMKWYGYMAVLLVNVFFFFLTGSKTGLLGTVFAIVYAGIFHLSKKDIVNKICGICGILITMGSVAISVIIAANAYHVYNYDWSIDRSAVPAFFKKLDVLLTGRIRSLTENERWEGTIRTWKLFSEPANDHYFDMGWIRLFYWYGIVPACVFIAVLLVILLFCYKKKMYPAIGLIVSFALYSVMEAHAVSVYLARNYVLFLIGAYWSSVLKGEERDEHKT